MPKKIYSVEDVAKFLKVHKLTVHRAINSGKLGAFRVGKRLLVTAEQLSASIEAGKTQVTR